jgi:hypothetical protein
MVLILIADVDSSRLEPHSPSRPPDVAPKLLVPLDAQPSQPPWSKAKPTAPFTEAQVCRAAIASMMGHSPSIVKARPGPIGEFSLSYRRPSDGSEWENKCRLSGDRVHWGTKDGRWRLHPADSKLHFAITGSGSSAKLTITEAYLDGSKSVDSYTLAQVGGG